LKECEVVRNPNTGLPAFTYESINPSCDKGSLLHRK